MKHTRNALMMIATLIIIAILFVACNPQEQTVPTDTKHTATFVTNGGSSVEAIYDEAINVEPHTERSGHTFGGWFDNAALSGSRVTFPYALTADVTLYAKWVPVSETVEYTATFQTNGGSAVAPISGTSIENEPITQKSENTFEGWFDNAELNGDRITFPYTLTRDITLYAKWESTAVEESFVQTALSDYTTETGEDGVITLTKYNGADSKIILPKEGEIFVGEDCFDQEENTVTAIRIPTNVTGIDAYCFAAPVKLAAIEVEENHPSFCAVDNVLFSADKKKLVAYPCARAGETYSIPDGVTEVGEFAFYYKYNLKGVSIPEGVETLGTYCFGYVDFEEVSVPASVTTTGFNVFYKCDSLKRITGPVAIRNLSSLKALEYVEIIGDAEATKTSVFNGSTSIKTVKITAPIKTVGLSTFAKCSALTEVILPDTVTLIGTSAFSECTALESIKLPSSLTEIASGAFSGCTSLKCLDIPEGVTKLGTNYIKDTPLKEIHIPSTITSMSNFNDNTTIETVYCPASFITKLHSGISAFEKSPIQNLIITSGDSIPSTQGSSYTTLGHLHTLVIPACVTSIDKNAFNKAYGLVQITNLSSVDWVPNFNTFSSDDLPSSAEIRRSESAQFEGTITREENGLLKYTFKGEVRVLDCDRTKTSVTQAELAGYTSIGGYAFAANNALTEIHMPSSIKSVGAYAFRFCYGLATVTLSDGLEEIGAYAFSGASELNAITIPQTVTKIGQNAFTTENMVINVKGRAEKPSGWANNWYTQTSSYNITVNWNA